MKKRILASLMSLCLVVGLLPAAALAAEDEVPDSETTVVCAELEGCVEDAHDEGCPLYEAPEEEPAEEPAVPADDNQDFEVPADPVEAVAEPEALTALETAEENATIQISSSEGLVNAIQNQKEGQTWILADGTYDVVNGDDGGYSLSEDTKLNNSNGPFVFPIYVDGLTIQAAEGADVTITSSYDPNTGNWNGQNFITIGSSGVTIEGVKLKGNPNGYYGGQCNKVIELVGNGENFTLKDVELLPIEDKEGNVSSGSIYINVSDPGESSIEDVTMYSWINARAVTNGEVDIVGLTQDFTNNTYAGYNDSIYGYAWNPGVSGTAKYISVTDFTIKVDSNTNLEKQIFNDGLIAGTTVELAAGEYDLGSLKLTKPVNLVGAGAEDTILTGSVIYGNGKWEDVDESETKQITWEGVTLKAPTGENENHQGLCWSTGVEGYTLNIEDCIFDGWKYAIGVNSGATGNTLNVSDTAFEGTFCAMSVKDGNTLNADAVQVPAGSFAVQKFGSGAEASNKYYYTVEDAEAGTNGVDGSAVEGSGTWPAAAAIGSKYYSTIQAAITAAKSGDTVLIMDGEHVENISIPAGKVLTLQGQSENAVIKFNVNDKDESGSRKNAVVTDSRTYYPVVYAQSDLILKNLTIAGPTTEHHGIDGIYATAGLTMENVVVKDIRCTAGGAEVCGVQYGVGVTVTGSGNVTIKDCEFSKFQKQAISLNTTGTQLIQDNLIQGVGAQQIIGQNGIVVWAGDATITNNTIKDLVYSADNGWAYCSYGILVYGENTSATVNRNTLEDVDNGLYADDGVSASIGTNNYVGGAFLNGEWCSVDNAFFYAKEGDTIRLNENVVDPLIIDEAITLDGNGYKVTGGIQVTTAGVTLKDLNVEAEGAALTVGSQTNSIEGKITITGGSYISATNAGQGSGAMRLFASDVSVTGVTTTGGIHVFNAGTQNITGNKVGFNYTGNTPFVGILLYYDSLPAGVDAKSVADSLMQDNQISVPNTGSDYVQVAYSDNGTWIFPGQIPANDSAAKIGDNYYKTLQDAVDAVADNGKITLVKDSSENVSVSRVVTFTIQAETGVSYTGRVSAGSGYRVSESNGTYIVTKYTSGGGGGSSGSSSYTVSVDSTKNGDVTVSPKSASKGTTVTITVKPDTGYELDELTVTDKNGDELKLTRKNDTQYTFTMPASKVTVEASFVKNEATSTSFIDVPTNAYYAEAVAWAVENGITNGTGTNTFGPDVSCTRAQMVTFLWRAAGSPRAAGANPFTDVSSGAYYYDAVLWAVENGITTGTSATTFSPDVTVTRGQTVTFLYRNAGSPAASGSSFADVSADAYYADAVAWAVAEGITNGTGGNAFSPDAACTRAQIVTFLWRDME